MLMGNHFHLLLETPEANLVVGMKWLLGTFSQGWNHTRQRRGWYLGEESFKDKLLAMLDRARIGEWQRKAKTGVASDHGEGEAERLINEAGKVLGLPIKRHELKNLRKSDDRKALLAAVLRRRTAVGANWISERLAMGDPESVSRMLGAILRDKNLKKRLRELEKMLNSGG